MCIAIVAIYSIFDTSVSCIIVKIRELHPKVDLSLLCVVWYTYLAMFRPQ